MSIWSYLDDDDDVLADVPVAEDDALRDGDVVHVLCI